MKKELNERLRREEDRIEKAKRFHTYKGGKSMLNTTGHHGAHSGSGDSGGSAGGDGWI